MLSSVYRSSVASFAALLLVAGVVVSAPAGAAVASEVKTGTVMSIPAGITVSRIGGVDRFAVANAIARKAFPGTANTVYVTSGADYPDALSAAPAAILQDAPLLLTQPSALPSSVAAEIRRLAPRKIVVVGGPAAVSQGVVTALKRLAPTVRISGADRYASSLAIANYAFGAAGAKGAYISAGANFPDALTAGSPAGSNRVPVLLVNGRANSANTATKGLLHDLDVDGVKIAGSTAVVSSGIATSLASTGITVERFQGVDRFATSISVNNDAYSQSATAYLATAFNYPDALAGSVLAGRNSAPLFIVPPTCVPPAVLEQFALLGVRNVVLLGGTAALSNGVAALTPCGGAPALSAPIAPAPVPVPVVVPAPVSSGWPDASNTGVPAGVTLKPYSGPFNITKAGTVIDGYDIKGALTISAPDVTIKNSRVTGRIDTGDSNQNPRTLIQRVEIIGPYDSAADGGFAAVGYTGFTCDGCNVRGWGKGFALVEDVVVKNSWVHDIVVHGDPANGGSHNETIISLGGSNFQILNNRLDAGDAPNVSASLALYSQMAPFNNVLVQGNLFDGGGYCVYAGLAGSDGASNTKFVGNTFGNKYSSNCGGYGPAIAYESGNGNAWTGNVLQSTGAPVATPGRG